MEPVIETMRKHSKLPIGALVSFNPTPKGFRTMMGVDPTSATTKLDELGADIIGITCGGIDFEETTAVLQEMAAVCNRHLFARPNAGVPDLINGKVIHPGTPEGMSQEAGNWVEAGARLISGCCGTTPEHIKKTVAALKKG